MKENKLIKNRYFKDIYSYILPILGTLFVMMEEAFLFNPFILAILFISYYKSGLTYLFCILSMIVTATLINSYYGLEILIISIVQFMISFGFAKLKIVKIQYSIITLCLLISFIMLAKSFSISNLLMVIFNIFLVFIFTRSVINFIDLYKSQIVELNELDYIITVVFCFIAAMVYPIVGLILLRLFLLFSIDRKKNIVRLLLYLISFIMLHLVYYYSLNYCAMILLPIIIVDLLNKKHKNIIYLVSVFIISLLLDPIFYKNGLFYQGLVAGVLILIIDKNKILKIESDSIRFNYKDKVLKNLIIIEDYLSAINVEIDDSISDLKTNSLNRVYQKVCEECEHNKYCLLLKELGNYFKSKLSTKDKKQIVKRCLKPQKMIIELQNTYGVYQSEEKFYISSLKRKSTLNKIISNLKTPIINSKKEIIENKTLFDILDETLKKENITFIKINKENNKIILISNTPYNEDEKIIIISILLMIFKQNYYVEKEEILYLRQQYKTTIALIEFNNIKQQIYTYSASGDNGDTTFVDEINNNYIAILSDGMGHTLKSKTTSKAIVNAIVSLLKQDDRILKHIEEINDIFKVKMVEENYATLDFVSINRQTLIGEIVKCGAVHSFVIRNQEIIVIDNGGIPIGVIDDVNYYSISFKFEKNDIFIMMSDGIIEEFKEFNLSHQIKNEAKDLSFQELFNRLVSKMKHLDDATMIVLEIL